MDVKKASMKWQAALVYLFDIVIFSNGSKKHITYVKQVLTSLQKAKVTSNLKSFDPLSTRPNILDT